MPWMMTLGGPPKVSGTTGSASGPRGAPQEKQASRRAKFSVLQTKRQVVSGGRRGEMRHWCVMRTRLWGRSSRPEAAAGGREAASGARGARCGRRGFPPTPRASRGHRPSVSAAACESETWRAARVRQQAPEEGVKERSARVHAPPLAQLASFAAPAPAALPPLAAPVWRGGAAAPVFVSPVPALQWHRRC